jgi:hypothetical protein
VGTAADPRLSVIVTVVEGGAALERTLAALASQTDAPPLEVLVPFDATVRAVGALAARFPSARFLDLGVLPTEQPAHTMSGEHELFDRRRAAGLREATGDLIAIIEDRGTPRADWARTAVTLHATLPHGVIGGAINPLPSGLLEFAVHVCDFTRYTAPFTSGVREWVSDVNVVYSRDVMEATRPLWSERYQEPVVHWALQQQGEQLYLSDALVVLHQRAPRSVSQLLDERFHWGRLFGAIRGRSLPLPRRLMLGVAAPVLPFVLLQRHARAQAAKGKLGRVLLAVPALLLLLVAWSAGEATGVLTRRS